MAADPVLISVHLPKTAGGTFREHLIGLYAPDICFDFTDQYTFIDTAPPTLVMRMQRTLRAYKLGRSRLRETDRCIHGHFRADKYRTRFPDARLVTWLRDPVERVVSHYRHWKRNRNTSHSISRRLLRENLDLVQFAEIDVMRNLQSRYLNGVPLQDFWFVGVQEYFEAMIPHFYAQLGLEAVAHKAITHDSEKPVHDRYALDPETWVCIDALNQQDRALYTQALERARHLGIPIAMPA